MIVENLNVDLFACLFLAAVKYSDSKIEISLDISKQFEIQIRQEQ
jgi:hypothetical protein